MSARTPSSRPPGPASIYGHIFIVRTFAVMWTLGGAIVMFHLALFDDFVRAEGPLWVISCTAVGTGTAVWAFRARLPAAVFVPGTYLGVATITAAVLFAGDGRVSSALVLLYVWSAIFAFLFFPVRTAVLVGAFATVSHAAAVTLIGSPSLASPLMLLATIVMVGLVIGGLHRARSASEVDDLTGAANRTGLNRLLELRLAGGGRQPDALAVVMLDVDGFRQVNALDGHTSGDRLLRALAELWQAELTDGDLLARINADRFAVVLLNRTSDDVETVVHRMRSVTPVPVTSSAGVAFWEVGDSPAMLLRRTAAALYEAKKGGRDRTVVDGQDGSVARELAAAIEHDELALMSQPIVDARTGRISGFETLVRWQHPDRGVLGPMEFIPVAERTGLIVPLGLWVLNESCRHARSWLERFPSDRIGVAVNVSGRQLEHPGFVDEVAAVLERHQLPADLLTLELTESTLAHDIDAWKDQLWRLRKIGVQLSMDDFGTGYSSLNQLRRLPFGTIKIDRSFVSDLPESGEASALIAAMVGMADGLGKRTVAEGVETAPQLDELRRLGCDQLQGYLLGRPGAIKDAISILRQQDELGPPLLVASSRGAAANQLVPRLATVPARQV